MRFRRRTTVVLQLAGAFSQLLLPTIPIAVEWKPFLQGLIAFCQVAQAILAHSSNPDGTPASVAYISPHDPRQ